MKQVTQEARPLVHLCDGSIETFHSERFKIVVRIYEWNGSGILCDNDAVEISVHVCI